MQAVCASTIVLAVFIASILCLAEVHITTPRHTAEDLKEHGSLILECRSTGPHATWTHNGHSVSNTTGRFVITENKTRAGVLVSILILVRAEPEDAGTYTCGCPHSKTADSINVTVAGLERHSRVMIDGPTVMEMAVGSQLRLTCKADIHSNVEWLLNNLRLAKSTNDVMTTKRDESGHVKTVQLVRNDLAVQDFGVYSCRNERDSKDAATVTVKSPTLPYQQTNQVIDNANLSSANGFRRHAMEATELLIPLIIGMMIAMAQ